jgi:hypothetical protein
VLSELTTRLRSACRRAQRLTRSEGGRHVDFGIELRVVRQDLERGEKFVPGAPPLRPIRVHRMGGILDTVERRFVGDTLDPVVWYTGERQAELLLDVWFEREKERTRTLLLSAEGFGKTTLMMQGHVLFLLTLIRAGEPGDMGCTAPTDDRLSTCRKTLGKLVPIGEPRDQHEGDWAVYFADERELRWASGHVTQFRQTRKQSSATGSPIQGYTWKRSDDDEVQDSWEGGADADIEMRLRGSETSYRWATATAKDSSKYREVRDAKRASPDWREVRFPYTDATFIWPSHWERAKRNMSPREWARRGEARDVGPERMTYTTWDRAKNLRRIPELGATDISAEVLAQGSAVFHLLAGHDPGNLFDVSIFLRPYRLAGVERRVWWVVGELTTEETTTEQHVAEFLATIRPRWSCNDLDWRGRATENGRRVLVRADPYSDSGNDEQRPDRSVYTTFRKHGISIVPAAVRSVSSSSRIESKAWRIPRQARIEMVCSLLLNSDGERRLFIDLDEQGRPVAPRLVEALEQSQRDGDGKAETQRKDKLDLSHWPAALGYALWSYERPRMYGEAEAAAE